VLSIEELKTQPFDGEAGRLNQSRSPKEVKMQSQIFKQSSDTVIPDSSREQSKVTGNI